MLNIVEGKIRRPQKVVIYGPEGIGKTTLASDFPDPLFIDTENGTSNMDVKRVSGIDTWQKLTSTVKEVTEEPGVCKTLVIDTADHAEEMAARHITKKKGVDSIEAFGYGKGYTYLGEEFKKLLDLCDKCIKAGINVVIVAHSKLRKFEEPDEMGAYDRYELKLTRAVAPLVKEWCDCLLFVNYKTYVVKDTDTNHHKAQGGERVIYTTHSPSWDAKNRYELPDMMPLDYHGIASIFDSPGKPSGGTSSIVKKILEMCQDAGVTEEQIEKVAAERKSMTGKLQDYPQDFLEGWVLRYWKNIIETIKKGNSK